MRGVTLSGRARELVTAGLVLVVVVLLGLLGSVFFFRLDLTEEKVFTISDVSRELFDEMPERAEITYYVSDRLRDRAVETQQIIDILEEYEARARGSVSVDVVDPKESEEAERAEDLGVVPQQIEVVEEDQRSLATVYSGIVVEYLDEHRTLPVAFDPGEVEYRVTSALRGLVHGERDVVGVLVGDGSGGLSQKYGLFGNHLARDFEVREIRPGAEIPEEVTVLVVLGATALEQEDLRPIDRYVSGGGNALFAVEGVEVDTERTFAARPVEDMPMRGMLESYGVRVEPELVLDQSNRRIPVRRNTEQGTVQTLEPYPHWVSIRYAGARQDHPVTARFSGLDLFWPSPLTVVETDARAILETTPDAWVMSEDFAINPNEPAAFERQREQTRGSYVVGAAVSGQIESYFGEGSSEADLLILGDSAFAGELIEFTESDHNLEFALNAVTWLSKDRDLLDLRRRTTRDMRLTAIENEDLRRAMVRVAEAVNIYLVPLLVAGFGVLRFARRRARSRAGDWDEK
ncbi:MAG: GldG family protein [Spirochaetaceae bacterium]